MDTRLSQKKPTFIGRLSNRRGFSLIEMAIVLVIIGIIIGAIVKGQDMIANAHAKKVISAVSSWRNLTITFLDRNGRFPGDQNKNGVIGDQAAGAPVVEEQTAATSAIAELVPVMQTAPENPVLVGSTSFWVYIGNTTAGTVPVAQNAILVCGSSDCVTPFTSDQLEIIKAMDTAFDGSADGGLGNFRSVTSGLTPLTNAAALVGTRMSASFTGTAVAANINTSAGSTSPWTTTNTAAVWLFDKPF